MKIKTTQILFLFAATCCVLQAAAQDAHFSQFYNTPIRQNPAMTGLFNGTYRIGANYRDQWASVIGSGNAYKTYHVGADMNTFVMKNDYAGLGIYVLGDQAGNGKFGSTSAVLSGAYVKQLSGRKRGWKQAEHYLSGGLQVGAGQVKVDYDNLKFSTQFNGDGYDGRLGTGENLGATSKIFIDVNAGLLYYALLGNNVSVYAGGSVNHVNQPNISLFDRSEPLFMRYNVNIGGEIPLSKELSLLPGATFSRQGPSQMILAGTNIRYSNKDWREVVLKAGVWDRLSASKNSLVSQDALILFAGIDFERYSLGLSYDLNMSSLQTASNTRGGYELSLIYIHPQRKRLSVNCPRFR